MIGKRWAIVLAGGEGARLAEFITAWLGSHRPKQYCAFTGRKTMLERTLERARRLVPRENLLTVIGPGHRRYINGEAELSGPILEQPRNLDTVAGIFLPLAHILNADPDATALIFPSDHFIAPTRRFIEHVEHAASQAEEWNDFIILLGAVPDRCEPEFGWIELDHPAGKSRIAQVSRFTEKPEAARAKELYREGALWNTMVMAAKARTLWDLGRRCMPEVSTGFAALKDVLGTPEERSALTRLYASLPPRNFSKEILERCADRTAVLAMDGVMWNDWGRPERIRQTLETVSHATFNRAFHLEDREGRLQGCIGI